MDSGEMREGRTIVSWVSRCRNSADALSHPYTAAQMKEHFSRVGVEVRSELASSPREVCWRSHHAGTMSGGRSLDLKCLGQTCLVPEAWFEF